MHGRRRADRCGSRRRLQEAPPRGARRRIVNGWRRAVLARRSRRTWAARRG
ncbi:hypothetical protein BURMUCGD1_0254 [Burkholderia multivorans CGD1]|nr:hypothetical protein BURMUCGD1_0254 [Burkholderia multivorans CGD1]